MTGQTIAHYQVVEKLGEGGMGVVWKARDTHLDRFVALKILPSDKVADPDRRRRFVQEARAVSPLNHANIVTVYDIDSAGDTHFIAMEYVADGRWRGRFRRAAWGRGRCLTTRGRLPMRWRRPTPPVSSTAT